MTNSPEERARELGRQYGIGYAKALEIVLNVETVMDKYEAVDDAFERNRREFAAGRSLGAA